MSEYSLIRLLAVPASEASRRRRVPALAPDERRAALIEATVPLLRAHGATVSTRQIAQAAGVAEGTIFGVFADKTTLIRCAVVRALDPTAVETALAAIDPAASVHTRLAAAADVLSRRFTQNGPVLAAAREMMLAPGTSSELREQFGMSRERILAAVAAVLEPDRSVLRRSPAEVAQLLMLVVSAGTLGVLGGMENVDGADIAALLLDGLLVRPTDTVTNGGSKRC
jgi:AcrR family transcriptional regulator